MKKTEYLNIYKLEEKHWWYLGMKKISWNFLKQYLPGKKLKILDAGCGTGGMMKEMKSLGDVWGIDLSPYAIKYCREKDLSQVKLASVEEIPFDDNCFDLVTSFDVLYHQRVKSDTKAFSEFYRVLKPNGLLLLRVPAYNWLWGKHDLIVATRHRYARNELSKKLQKAGFKIKRATYANTILFPWVLFKRTLEKILSDKESSDVQDTQPIINNFLKQILIFESKILSKFDLPFGLSLYVLAQKD